MKKAISKTLIFAVVFLAIGFANQAFAFRIGETITIGNRSYVPISLSRGELYDDSAEASTNRAKIVLWVLADFEKNHPQFEVTNWRPYIVNSQHIYSEVLGI